jgi:hypothetical protein
MHILHVPSNSQDDRWKWALIVAIVWDDRNTNYKYSLSEARPSELSEFSYRRVRLLLSEMARYERRHPASGSVSDSDGLRASNTTRQSGNFVLTSLARGSRKGLRDFDSGQFCRAATVATEMDDEPPHTPQKKIGDSGLKARHVAPTAIGCP